MKRSALFTQWVRGTAVAVAVAGFALWAWAATLSEPYTTAGNYTYDSNLVLFTGTTATLKNGITFAHDTQAEFNGAVSNVTVQTSSPWVKQNATTAQGAYTSPTSGAGLVDGGTAAPTWGTFTATKSVPWGDALVGNETSLIGLWHLDDAGTDATANANHGTLTNGVTFAGGRLGSAGNFNGSDQFVSVPDNGTVLDPSSQITVAAWVNTNAVGSYQTIASKPAGTSWVSPYARYNLRLQDSANSNRFSFFAQQCCGANLLESTVSASAGTWYHVVGTHDGSTIKLYINGALDTSSALSTTITDSDRPLAIGQHGNSGQYWNGLIDEVAIYNTALDATAVLNLYKRGATKVQYFMRTSTTTSFTDAWSSSIASVPARQYLQYQVLFDTLDATNARPDVTSITVTTTGYPIGNIPITRTAVGDGFTWLTSFAQNGAGTSEPVNTSLKYALSPDGGTTWYYHNGTDWTSSADGSPGGTAANTNTNIAGFDEAAAAQLTANTAGSVKIRTFLATTSTSATPTLDNVDVGYENSTLSLTAPTTGTIWHRGSPNTITSSSTGTTVPDQVVEYSAAGDFSDTVTATTTTSHTPAARTSGATAKVRVRSTSVPKLTVTSDAVEVRGLSSTNVQPASLSTGAVGLTTVSFTANTAIPVNGKVLVDFPDTFAVSSGAATAISGTPANITGLSVTGVNTSTRVVTLTSTGAASAGAAVSFVLTNIKNPTSAGSTGAYAIQTTTSADVLIEQDLAVVADTITASAYTAGDYSYDTSGNYAVSNSALVTFTGTAVTLAGSPSSFLHDTTEEFNGTHSSTAWQTTLVGGSGAGLQLNAVGSGSYTGATSGAGLVDAVLTTPAWGTFTATKSFAWGDALVGNEANLVGLWHLNNDGNDATANANHGTMTDGATFDAAGRLGPAGSFDGVNDRIVMGHLDMTTAVSFSVWFKATTTSGYQCLMGHFGSGDGIQIDASRGDVSTARFWLRTGGAWSYIETAQPAAGLWHHMAGTWDGGTMTLYMDGAAVASGAKSGIMSNTTSLLSVGTYRDFSNGSFFGGLIDEVAIYNTALDATAILNLYKRGVATVSYSARTSTSASFSDGWTAIASGGSLSGLTQRRYLQYKVDFATLLPTTYRPDVKTITITTGGSGFQSGQSVTPVTGTAFTWLTGFTETADKPANTAIKYALSPNGDAGTPTYYWYTAGAWAAADGTSATANTKDELIASSNAALAAFDNDVPTGSTGLTANTAGTLKVKAFLLSTTGAATPTLSNLDIGYENSVLDLWGPLGGTSWTVGQTIPITWSSTGADVPAITVEYSPGGAFGADVETAGTNLTSIADSPRSYVPLGASSGAAAKVRIRSTSAPKLTLDSGAFTVAPGALNGTNVEPALLAVGYVGSVTVTFTTINPIPSGGKIVITMPSGYALNSGATTAISGAPTGVTGTGSVSITGQVVTITGLSQASAQAVSLVLTNIKNPTVTGSTGVYQIKTTTSADATIDEKTNVAADTITGPILNVLAPTTGDSWPVTTTHTLKWRVDGTIPSGATVKLFYLKTDTTWGTVIPLSGEANNEVSVTRGSPSDATGQVDWVLPTDAANATAQIKIEHSPAWSPAAITGLSASYKVTPFLGLTHPTGGQKWAVGSPHKITWQTQGTIARVTVEYSVNGGAWTPIVESYETANDGIVQNTSAGATWTPPAAAAHASVRIRIADSTDATNNTVSSPFKVTTLAVTAPTASGLRYLAGSTQANLITWTSTAVDNVSIFYSTAGSGGPWTQIGTTTVDSAKTAGMGLPAPAQSTTTAFIRIVDADAVPANNAPAGDTDTALIEDTSDTAFAIYGTLDVTAPDTATLQWASGQPQTIAWTVSPANANVVPLVKITVTDLVDSANNGTVIASTNAHSVAAGSGSYSWSPSFTTTNAKITVEDVADALSTNTATNAVKLIGVTPQWPAGGESWLVGSQQVIKFSFTSGTLTQARMEYTTNNGTSYALLAAGSMQGSSDDVTYTAISGDGSAVAVGANPFYIKWTVPDAISKTNDAKVRITNLNGGAYGTSGAFTITGALAMNAHTPAGVLSVGDVATLSWVKTGTISSVKVELSPAGTFADTLVSVGTSLTGSSTTWTVTDHIGTTGKLRVTSTLGTGYPTFFGTSADPVTIKGKLAFTAPVAGDAWVVGSDPVITWTTKGTIGTVGLKYATAADNYLSWTDVPGATALANTANGTASFTWTTLPDLVGNALAHPSSSSATGVGTRGVQLKITDGTSGHTGALQEIVPSAAFTAKWWLITYNIVNADNQALAGLSVEDTLGWIASSVTSGTWSSKHYYKQGPVTATWSAGTAFNPQTETFTADADKTITAIMTSTNPDVFDVKYESFYDAGNDTVKAKAYLMRRGLLVNTSLTSATMTILSGTTVKGTATDTAADANGLFEFSFKAADYSLTASDSYFVKIAITYNGQVKNGAGTLNITLPSETKSIITLTGTAADAAAANTLFGKMADIKTEVIDRLGAMGDTAAANSLFGRLKNLDKLLGETSDTGSAESVFGRLAKTQSELASKVQSEAAKGPQTGILNREQFVKSGTRATIRYRTATGLSPKIDVYDASSNKKISGATMTEIATTGIYEYPVTFETAWGTGDHTIIVSESTKSSTDSMIMTVSTTDLEAIAKKAGGSSSGGGSTATDITPLLAEVQALKGMVAMGAGAGGLVGQVTALQHQLSSMQAQLGLVAATDEELETAEAVDASAKATMSVRDQLREIAKTMKEMSGPSGLSLHQLFDMQEAQITTAKDLQNKIEQIKQATEVTKRIAEEGRQKVQVQTWFESGSVILKILAVNPTDEEQTVPVKAYLPKEVKAEHVMDLGPLTLEYDPDRQMHFVTATVTLQPNESAVFAIEVEDIWQIPQEHLTRLSDDAKTAVKQMTGTEYEERATLLASQIDLKLASVWERQSDPTLTPEQHIQTHRQNVEVMKRLEDDLALLKRMAVTVMNPDAPKTPESEFLNQAFSGVQSNWDAGSASPIAVSLKTRLTTDATWRLILGMVVFVGLMSLAAFLLWQRQAHLAMTAEQQLLQQAEGPGPPGTGPPPGGGFSKPTGGQA